MKGGGWINAVGLSNPGAETFAKMIELIDDVPIVVSLVGSVEDDFEYMINDSEAKAIICSENLFENFKQIKKKAEVNNPEIIFPIPVNLKNCQTTLRQNKR